MIKFLKIAYSLFRFSRSSANERILMEQFIQANASLSQDIASLRNERLEQLSATISELELREAYPAVQNAWEQYQIALKLVKK